MGRLMGNDNNDYRAILTDYYLSDLVDGIDHRMCFGLGMIIPVFHKYAESRKITHGNTNVY